MQMEKLTSFFSLVVYIGFDILTLVRFSTRLRAHETHRLDPQAYETHRLPDPGPLDPQGPRNLRPLDPQAYETSEPDPSDLLTIRLTRPRNPAARVPLYLRPSAPPRPAKRLALSKSAPRPTSQPLPWPDKKKKAGTEPLRPLSQRSPTQTGPSLYPV